MQPSNFLAKLSGDEARNCDRQSVWFLGPNQWVLGTEFEFFGTENLNHRIKTWLALSFGPGRTHSIGRVRFPSTGACIQN